MTVGLSDVTKEGLVHVRPDREAIIGANAGDGGRPRRRKHTESVVPEPEFRSYYGLPVLNKPTWEPLDIAGYLFLGGLAGSSSTLAAAAELTGRPALARPLKYGAAGAIGLSLVALVHDLGRPGRFYNMLRVFKPSSPMSVGSWILSLYGPAAFAAAGLQLAGSALPGPLGRVLSRTVVGRLSRAATLAAAVTGPAVATYTAVLVSDTAVPAWHGGHKEMPFLFAGSACSAGAGLGLMAAPVAAAGPARRLGPAAALVELGVGRFMRSRMGLPAETYEQGTAGKLMKAAEAATVAGAVGALAGRRSRAVSAVSGALLVAGSALTRFGIFHAGVQSAEDPRYTVVPQRERADTDRGSA
ncbi:MAG TPA: NrfD/PsrC family molybdoenzyme membrane anchor subunit [Acidimicrobiales bacterium]|nr:NrfD/PsrC family molybdoenzyme membrane anchor subunit [Acidimicrobiales bacterium]